MPIINSQYMPLLIVGLVLFLIIETVSAWITFEKAGAKGYQGIIPIYNVIVLSRLANIPVWMIVLAFVPIVQLWPLYLIFSSLAERLGRSKVFGILLTFLPFILIPILAVAKTKIEKNYMNIELEEDDDNNSVLMDGPIEPLDAIPDIEKVEAPSSVTDTPVPITDSITPNIVANMMDMSLEPVENVVPITIEDPLQAQSKVQYVEDKKEVYPDVNIFKTCPNCGNKLEPNAKACFLCGKRLDEEN